MGGLGNFQGIPRMKERLALDLEREYPNLTPDAYKVTSRQDKRYNCVGWAAKRDQHKWWEPIKEPGCFWPPSVPFDHSFRNYVKVFESLGYVECKDAFPENGLEKVALFKDLLGHFTHVSHQLENGTWSSKLGPFEDVRHDTNYSLEGKGAKEGYGYVSVLMKRRRQIWDNPRKPSLISIGIDRLCRLLSKCNFP